MCESNEEEQKLFANPGATIVRAMVVGCASDQTIREVAGQFWSFFEDGSAPARWNANKWNDFSDGIWHVLSAIERDGLDSGDIAKALHRWAQEKRR